MITLPNQQVMRFADAGLLAELVALLPKGFVNVRHGEKGIVLSYVPSLVAAMLDSALCEGHTIDRTNRAGAVSEWDGWLVIENPEKPIFLQIAKAGGEPL